jgi:hypothetical protein
MVTSEEDRLYDVRSALKTALPAVFRGKAYADKKREFHIGTASGSVRRAVGGAC